MENKDFDPTRIQKVSIEEVEPNDYNPKEVDTPEYHNVVESIRINGLKQPIFVREVEGNFARYRRSDVGDMIYIDVEIEGGSDTLSYTIEQWRSFRKEHDRAAVILGVEI